MLVRMAPIGSSEYRYNPLKGRIRYRSEKPYPLAILSAYRPAAFTTYPAVNPPAEVWTPFGPPDRYRTPHRMSTPSRTASPVIAAITWPGLTVEVVGENRARSNVFTRGSMRRAASSETS